MVPCEAVLPGGGVLRTTHGTRPGLAGHTGRETGSLGGFDCCNQFPEVGARSKDSLSAIPEARISARAASRIRGQ